MAWRQESCHKSVTGQAKYGLDDSLHLLFVCCPKCFKGYISLMVPITTIMKVWWLVSEDTTFGNLFLVNRWLNITCDVVMIQGVIIQEESYESVAASSLMYTVFRCHDAKAAPSNFVVGCVKDHIHRSHVFSHCIGISFLSRSAGCAPSGH